MNRMRTWAGLRRLPLTDRITYWYELWAGSLAGVFGGVSLSLIPIIARNIGLSGPQMAFMLSMPFVGFIVSLVLGHYVRGRSARAWVLWSDLAARVVLLGVVVARTPLAFMIILSTHYALSTLSGPAYAAIIKANYSDANRGTLMSRIRIVYTAIVAVSAALAGLVLESHPQAFRWVVPLGTLFGIAAAVVFGRLKVRRAEEHAAGQGGALATLRAILRDKGFLALMVIFMLVAGAPKMVIPLEPILLVDEIGMDYRQAGVITGTITAITAMAGYWIWGRLSKRRGALELVLFVFILGTLRNPLLALSRVPWHIIPVSVVTGLGNSGYDLIPFLALIALAGPGRLPVYIAFHNSLVGVRGLIGPYLGTALHDAAGMSISSIYWLVTAISTVGVVAMAVFLARRRAPVGLPRPPS